jgi:hypothetical protein
MANEMRVKNHDNYVMVGGVMGGCASVSVEIVIYFGGVVRQGICESRFYLKLGDELHARAFYPSSHPGARGKSGVQPHSYAAINLVSVAMDFR